MFGMRPTFVSPFMIKSIPGLFSIINNSPTLTRRPLSENLDLLSALSHRLWEQSPTGSATWAKVSDLPPMHRLLLLAVCSAAPAPGARFPSPSCESLNKRQQNSAVGVASAWSQVLCEGGLVPVYRN